TSAARREGRRSRSVRESGAANYLLVAAAGVDEDGVDLPVAALLRGRHGEAQGDLAPAGLLARGLRLELDVVAELPSLERLEVRGPAHVLGRELGVDDLDLKAGVG